MISENIRCEKLDRMKDDNLTFDESRLASLLRNEILKDFQTVVKPDEKAPDLKDMELISTNKTAKTFEEVPYVSPIFTMSEDEILAFVEEFEVGELATLSVDELNHIGKVLGVEPQILLGMKD